MTHSIMPGRHHRAHEGPGPVARGTHLPAGRARRSTWAVPVVGGIALGLFAIFLAGNNGYTAGPAVLIGVVAGLIAMAAGYALLRERNTMITEVRAAAFGALFGGSMGFLHSLSGGTVIRSSGIGVLTGIAMGIASYYVFYWHEHRADM
ncbi:hypothetical protein FGW37_13470 [Streptomyces rectiverticillatus]|uniref:hypothetical protein n=1 Tax=Streptomyces rectiverticillatus TaxID=173860 RepID=UPI0015C32957|nr:hypothetical protein [Streptomyces rectiverticillatus]QLE72476.1 hypothetical protein FGW37_13470 [Streptomyces rectiverticillatus]